MTGETQTFAPQTPHAWVSPEHEETVPVRRTEIKEFADEVLRIARNPLENASAWAAGLLTLSVSAGLSLAAIATTATNVPTWVYTAHGAVLFGGATAAWFAHWVNRKQRADSESRAELLADRIRACDERAPRVEGDQ
jgi:hypothetical protein